MADGLDPNQLEWIAAINGMTPQEYLDSQAETQRQQAETDAFNAKRRQGLEEYWKTHPQNLTYQDTGSHFGSEDPYFIAEPRTQAEIDEANRSVTAKVQGREYNNWSDAADAENDLASRFDSGLDPARQRLADSAASGAATRAASTAGVRDAVSAARSGNAAIQGQRSAATSAANQQSAQTLQGLQGAFGTANAAEAANIGNLQDRYDSYGVLQGSGPYQGISSDAGLVAQQQASYDSFNNWAAGGGDISSDPGLVQQQQDVYGGLMGYANGENDISSDPGLVAMQQGVYDDYGQFASGAMDLTSQAATAQADPEALAAQKEALSEFRARMDPKQTDAERFLYMQSRLAQEQSQRAARDANYRELERRGMGGSTMALSNLNASSAEASNTRALQDLGANAKAVDRAEKALVNYGNMSSTIADQSFQRDFATKSAADAMAINNNKQRLAGIQGQGQMATEMRNADDDIKKFNSQQRLSGLQSAGVVAGQMRDADDRIKMTNQEMRMRGTEGAARQANEMRTADDAMRTFNKDQEMIQTRHMDDFAAQQQRDAWERDTGLSDRQFRASENVADRADKYAGRAETATQNSWGRQDSDTRLGVDINRDAVEGADRVAGRSNEEARDNATDARGQAEFDLGAGRTRAEIEGKAIDTRSKQISEDAEDRRARQAEVAAEKRQGQLFEHDNEVSSIGDLLFG